MFVTRSRSISVCGGGDRHGLSGENFSEQLKMTENCLRVKDLCLNQRVKDRKSDDVET